MASMSQTGIWAGLDARVEALELLGLIVGMWSLFKFKVGEDEGSWPRARAFSSDTARHASLSNNAQIKFYKRHFRTPSDI